MPNVIWSRTYVLILLLLCGFAVGSLVWSTTQGAGLSHDSAVYIDTARHLARGHGWMTSLPRGGLQPLVRFPPLYPSLIAAGIMLGANPFITVRVLGTLFSV